VSYCRFCSPLVTRILCRSPASSFGVCYHTEVDACLRCVLPRLSSCCCLRLFSSLNTIAQHQLEQLDPDGTPMGTLLERYPGDGGNAHKLVLRRYLANFGLGGEVLPLQQISTMSGGQKCRLCLANAMYRQPHLLILDEPTSKCLHPDVACFLAAYKSLSPGLVAGIPLSSVCFS
jgi:hypothetical protein